MKQVLVIHGGDSFTTYEEYLEYLKTTLVELEGRKGWKAGLPDVLGPDYQVIQPRMPNAMNARYAEWKIWFEKYTQLVNDDIILIGHSLGGSFLARYLSEEPYPKRIQGTFLIAAPFDGEVEGTGDFAVSGPLDLLAEQGGSVFLYQSKDDELVPYTEAEKYKAALPNATLRMSTDRGHFLQEEFPELIADIKSL